MCFPKYTLGHTDKGKYVRWEDYMFINHLDLREVSVSQIHYLNQLEFVKACSLYKNAVTVLPCCERLMFKNKTH